MVWKLLLFSPGFVFIFNDVAYAATDATVKETNLLRDAVLGFFPIFLFLGLLFFGFRKFFPRGLWTKQMDQFERHKMHMDRMEALLERIAVALEKRGADRP